MKNMLCLYFLCLINMIYLWKQFKLSFCQFSADLRSIWIMPVFVRQNCKRRQTSPGCWGLSVRPEVWIRQFRNRWRDATRTRNNIWHRSTWSSQRHLQMRHLHNKKKFTLSWCGSKYLFSQLCTQYQSQFLGPFR